MAYNMARWDTADYTPIGEPSSLRREQCVTDPADTEEVKDYRCRHTLVADISSSATKSGIRIRLGTTPRSSPPISVPVIEPTAIVSTNHRFAARTVKLASHGRVTN